ncbi:MAG: phenylalanine 4-monooxygenase [Bacteriovorax sp.]|nr:phenylalanine 4-monooxygenase [Bacteriovorax sp.]
MKKKHIYQSKELDSFGCAQYSVEENQTWAFLLNRQKDLAQGRASKEFLKGVELLSFSEKIPQHAEVTAILKSHTGWRVSPVPALIQPELFFSLLSQKKFPAANFNRITEESDYIEEPDVFHELYGHCPLLTNAPYAEFMHQFGKLALSADSKTQMRLFRLFWFTIEFGLIRESGELKAYGGGILSSKSEIIYSVESPIAQRMPLDPLVALRTPFRIDILQPLYFVIESFDELFKLIEKKPIELAKISMTLPDFPARFEKRKKTKKKNNEDK